jgi:L-lactate dehydrogenase
MSDHHDAQHPKHSADQSAPATASPVASPTAPDCPRPEYRKVGVIGAGAVGTSVCYSALISGVADEVALYDIDEAKVRAEVLDLAHGTAFTAAHTMTGGADPAVLAGASVVVITAGAKQKPGQTRLDLAEANVQILRSLIPTVQEHAPDALLVLVTNPVDVLTLVAQRISGLPAGRVIGSGTLLDTARLRWLLASRVGVHPRSVHASVLGEHGDTEFPAWSTAAVGPVPLLRWPSAAAPQFTRPDLDAIADSVTNAAYEVIQGKGATNHAIGVATNRLLGAVYRDERAVLPVSTVLDGEHGLADVALSLPSIVGRAGVLQVLETDLDAGEIRQLHASARALREAASSLGF